MRACVFPGQGSQNVGMGKDFYVTFPGAKAVFDEVDETLAPFYGSALSNIIFEGPSDVLTKTLFTQAALMTVSMAILRVMEERIGAPVHQCVEFMAGHSLGEYSALCAAGVLTLKDTATLLYHRGKAMTECVPEDGGAMAAIMGLEVDAVWEIVRASGAFLANDNGGGQVVISGTKHGVEHAMEAALARGAKRAIPLPVSAPFHCPLMTDAAEVMKEYIANTTFLPPHVPIITNVTAEPVTDPLLLQENLVRQVCGSVRWRESILTMERAGVKEVVEVGAGKVLANLIKRITPSVQVRSVSSLESMNDLFDSVTFSSPPLV